MKRLLLKGTIAITNLVVVLIAWIAAARSLAQPCYESWASGFMTRTGTTGLIQVAIRP